MKTFRLMGGLGDCLISGAALQRLEVPVGFITNPKLKPIFEHHPTIKLMENVDNAHTFRWVSQIKEVNLYGLHTMQRFSSQVGLYLDPTDVLNIHKADGSVITNKGNWSGPILINQYSAEGTRRSIPSKYIGMIEEIVDGDFEIKYIGENGPNKKSTINIPDMIDILTECRLFIGPVSFCYHLAACLRTKSILFTSYMPPHKFSHFYKTTHITANSICSLTCEERRSACTLECDAFKYDDEEVYSILVKTIKGQ